MLKTVRLRVGAWMGEPNVDGHATGIFQSQSRKLSQPCVHGPQTLRARLSLSGLDNATWLLRNMMLKNAILGVTQGTNVNTGYLA